MSPALAAQPITPRVDDTQIDQCFDTITDLKRKVHEMERAVTELKSGNEKAAAQLAVAQNVLKFLNARYQSQKAEMEALRQRVLFLETKMGVAMQEDGENDEDDEDDFIPKGGQNPPVSGPKGGPKPTVSGPKGGSNSK